MRRLAVLTLLLLSPLPLAAGTLEKIGGMQIERDLHTATLLPDGRVLIAGDHVTRMELIEVRNGIATSTLAQAETIRPLAHHTATLLLDGQVLLIGGANEWQVDLWGDADVSAYRPDTLALLTRLHDARTRHQSTLLADGRVLVTGGEMREPGVRHTEFDSAEIVSGDGSVRRVSPMRKARTEHTATRLQDGGVLVVGGTFEGSADAEIFDPATETFAETGAPHHARVRHTATLLRDGRVLIAGGSLAAEDYAEIFDPATNQFTTTSLLYPQDTHAAVLMNDGTVLLAGGREVVVYDPRRDAVADRIPFGKNPDYAGVMGDVEWIELTGMAATLLPDGSVLLTGGLQTAHWPYEVSGIWRYKSRPTPKRRVVGR